MVIGRDVELPEFGSEGSGDGDSYFLAFLFAIPGLLLFSDSIVLLFSVGLEVLGRGRILTHV